MRTFLLFLILCSFPVWSKDLTEQYRFIRDNASLNGVIFKNVKVLIVPGVLAESFMSQSANQIKFNFLFEDGFSEQVALMNSLGADYEFVSLETENAPAVNAKVIEQAILRSKKPVLIYSHSKGGLDTLEAIRQNPKLLDKIQGWVSVQTPFYGAPVASEFYRHGVFRQTGQDLFHWMGGSGAGMSSLTEEERGPYMQKIEASGLLDVITKKIKFLNFASYKTNTIGIDTPLELFRNFTSFKAGANDGVVPLKSALLSKHGHPIDYILEPEVDHLMTMTINRLDVNPYDQRSHTLSLLMLLL